MSLHRFIATAVTLPLVVAAALVAGCDQQETIDGLVSDVISETNARVEVLCDCFEDYNYDSRGDCQEDNGEILPSAHRCVEDAYMRNEDAARSYLECRLPLLAELTDCLNSKLECDEGDSADRCYDDFEIGVRDCIDLPNSIDRALEDCG